MLKRKTCPHCEGKIKSSYSYCPTCGNGLGENKKDFGMLGKNDLSKKNQPGISLPGIGGGFMGKMLNNAMKMLEQEMNKEMGELNKEQRPKVKLMINGKEIEAPGQKQNQDDKDAKILPIEFSEKNLEKWRKIKKIEPNSELKRVDDKIRYNLDVPEVKSIKDISIVKLENSLEVRAIGKKKGYKKNISIDLPLKKYSLMKGILTLEMDTE